MILTDAIFGRKKNGVPPAPIEPNLLIGNMGSTYPNAASLALEFGVLESDFSYYSVVNNNIEAILNTEYILPVQCFNNTPITYFIDEKCVGMGGPHANTFAFCYNLFYCEIKNITKILTGIFTITGGVSSSDAFRKIILPEVKEVEDNCFQSFGNGGEIYLPKAQILGPTAGQDGVFRYSNNKYKLIANSYLQTANAGIEEGDIAYLRSIGGSITYINDFTPPSNIVDLSYSTGNLNFTAASSVNGIMYYEVFKNGVYVKDISGSGAPVAANSGDKIFVYACDIYYNRSKSNTIVV